MGKLFHEYPLPELEEPPSLEGGDQAEDQSPRLLNLNWSILTKQVTYKATASPSLTVTPLDKPQLGEPLPRIPIGQTVSDENFSYFDRFEGITTTLSESVTHHGTSDVGVTYIRLAEEEGPDHGYVTEWEFSFNPQAYTRGFLPNGKSFHILINTGATHSYFSKEFYESCPFLQDLPKYKPHVRCIYMGNGEWIPSLFIIQLTFSVDNQAFEVLTIVCKMADSDFVWGMKEIMETEGILCTCTMKFKFLNRSPRYIRSSPSTYP